MPACCRRPAPSRVRPAWRSMARRCAAASTSSATAPPRKCSASSPPTPRCAGAQQHRRQVKRDPGRPGSARQTRPRRSSGHARCPALPKKTFEAGADAQIDLIIQLKDNQPTLHQQAKDLCASATPLSHVSSRDRGRNRQEERSVAVFDAADTFTDTDWSSLVGAVIRVERDVLTRSASTGLWRRSTETAFYLSSAAITAARAAVAIRDHWKIENTSHHSRDVTMGEDRSRIRINRASSRGAAASFRTLSSTAEARSPRAGSRRLPAASIASSTSSAFQSVEHAAPSAGSAPIAARPRSPSPCTAT